MRNLALVFAISSTLSGHGMAAEIDVDAKACLRQLEALLRPDIDCVLELKPGPDVLRGVPDVLAVILPGMSCRIAIKLRKTQVYGEWISDSQARIPDFPVACTVSDSGRSMEFTALLHVECARTDNAWTCDPVLHETRGLGILRIQLENYINHDAAIRTALTKTLAGN